MQESEKYVFNELSDKENIAEFYEIIYKSFKEARVITKCFYELFRKTPIVKCFCIKDNDEIIGACCLFNFKSYHYISLFAVREDYQRKGIGRIFMKNIQKKYKTLALHVNCNNQPAINLYQSCGFKKYGRLNILKEKMKYEES